MHQIIGDKLSARNFQSQVNEIHARVAVLNKLQTWGASHPSCHLNLAQLGSLLSFKPLCNKALRSQNCSKVGIPLYEIKQALSKYPMGSKLTAQQWKELSLDWRKNLDERIQKLTRLRDEMDWCIGCGCLSLEQCPLRNPNDVLGQEGAGPRILERP